MKKTTKAPTPAKAEKAPTFTESIRDGALMLQQLRRWNADPAVRTSESRYVGGTRIDNVTRPQFLRDTLYAAERVAKAFPHTEREGLFRAAAILLASIRVALTTTSSSEATSREFALRMRKAAAILGNADEWEMPLVWEKYRVREQLIKRLGEFFREDEAADATNETIADWLIGTTQDPDIAVLLRVAGPVNQGAWAKEIKRLLASMPDDKRRRGGSKKDAVDTRAEAIVDHIRKIQGDKSDLRPRSSKR
jgi:hypothetical protein